MIFASNGQTRQTPSPPVTDGFPTEVFIAADQRCGGTSLNEIARYLLRAPCVDDPFTPSLARKLDDPDLPCGHPPDSDPAECLARLYRRWRCMKVCVTHWGPEFYRPVLEAAVRRGTRLVLLYRANALQRAISEQMMALTGVSGTYDWLRKRPQGDYRARRVSLDIPSLDEAVTRYQERTAQVRAHLRVIGGTFFDLPFETLYGSRQGMEDRFALLRRLCDFWQVDEEGLNTSRAYIEQVLKPRQRMNSPATYREMITNIDEIARELDPKGEAGLFED